MTEHDDKLREAVALFRYGPIADLAHLPRGARGIGGKPGDKAAATCTIPGTHRTQVSAETIRHWLTAYRHGGFEALHPKRRSDRGRPRRMAAEVAEALVAIKTQHPGYSVRALIAHAAGRRPVSGAAMPSESSVGRLLRREGLSGRGAAQGPATDRRRFNYRRACQLWMSDVMHGPKVPDGRRRRKTFLIAFIDDATRVIPHAAFAFAENIAAFPPVFKHALPRRGLPQRLYVDNGANHRSRHLAPVCAKPGIALIHARPYQPAGKGKIERWFRTLRAGWPRHPEMDTIDGIEALNRALAAGHPPTEGGERPMCLRHFAPARLPFETPAHADEPFHPDSHREAGARLKHLIDPRGIGLPAGESGSGKTTVCRHVTGAPRPGLFRVCHVPLSTGNAMDMHKSIGWEPGLPTEHSRAAAYRAIQAETARLVGEAKQQPVPVVDEAHHLGSDAIGDLGLPANFDMDTAPRLCLPLIGPAGPRRRPGMAVRESMRQRLIVQHRPRGLKREELDPCPAHRLRLAGCEAPLFEPAAIEALRKAARGLPRLVNRIAHHALPAAALEKARTVDAEHLARAVRDPRP